MDSKLSSIKEFFEELGTFTSLDQLSGINIPSVDDPKFYKEVIVKNLVRCGAIPKNSLVIGKTYLGECRNASEATWLGENFVYRREKFGYVFDETINHFEDDNGYDLFIPLYEKQ